MKKYLAIILAVVMLLPVFAVNSFAADLENGDFKVNFRAYDSANTGDTSSTGVTWSAADKTLSFTGAWKTAKFATGLWPLKVYGCTGIKVNFTVTGSTGGNVIVQYGSLGSWGQVKKWFNATGSAQDVTVELDATKDIKDLQFQIGEFKSGVSTATIKINSIELIIPTATSENIKELPVSTAPLFTGNTTYNTSTGVATFTSGYGNMGFSVSNYTNVTDFTLTTDPANSTVVGVKVVFVYTDSTTAEVTLNVTSGETKFKNPNVEKTIRQIQIQRQAWMDSGANPLELKITKMVFNLAEAKIGSTYYPRVADALAAYKLGDRIVLLVDYTTEDTLTLTDSLAFDLNGHNITCGGVTVNGGSLGLLNTSNTASNFVGGVTVTSGRIGLLGNVTVDSITLADGTFIETEDFTGRVLSVETATEPTEGNNVIIAQGSNLNENQFVSANADFSVVINEETGDAELTVGDGTAVKKPTTRPVAFIYVNENYHAMLINGRFLCMPHTDNNTGFCTTCRAEIAPTVEDGDVTEPEELPEIDMSQLYWANGDPKVSYNAETGVIKYSKAWNSCAFGFGEEASYKGVESFTIEFESLPMALNVGYQTVAGGQSQEVWTTAGTTTKTYTVDPTQEFLGVTLKGADVGEIKIKSITLKFAKKSEDKPTGVQLDMTKLYWANGDPKVSYNAETGAIKYSKAWNSCAFGWGADDVSYKGIESFTIEFESLPMALNVGYQTVAGGQSQEVWTTAGTTTRTYDVDPTQEFLGVTLKGADVGEIKIKSITLNYKK